MRRRCTLALAVLCALEGGCHSWVCYGLHNVVEEPAHCAGTIYYHEHYYKLAEAAWEQVCKANPDGYSCAYEYAFKRGFVYYMEEGELSKMPAGPTWWWRQPCYETPEGFQDRVDWNAGFRAGVEAARESGLHQFVILPSTGQTLRGYPYVPQEPPGSHPAVNTDDIEGTPPRRPAAPETLPTPRTLPSPEGEPAPLPPTSGPQPGKGSPP